SNTVVLFPGSATRAFTGTKIAALTSTTTAASFEGIAAGDFNHDGKLDLAVSEFQNSKVWITLGNGNGTFASSATQISAGVNPVGLAAGDVNGDMLDDLVVFDYGTPHSFQVLLQASGTGLAGALAYPTSGSTAAGALADVNHDGHLDIVAADQSDDEALVDLNSAVSPGSFSNNPPGFSTHPTPEHIAVADFDNDGHLDLVTTDQITSQIDVFLGAGDGSFATPVPLTGLPDADGLVVGDFTGDGLPDIVVTSDGTTPTITLIVNTSH
ncbi:MAG TPA: VCBS repeat-containing protein, partial [Polyangia bacterium]